MKYPGAVTKKMRRLSLVLLGLLVCYLFFEWMLGLAIRLRTTKRDGHDDDIGLRLYPAPYVMSELRTNPRVPAHICVINEQGFRHPEPVTREKTRPRVFVLGGSFALGAGGAKEDTYYLACLRKAFPQIEFVNAAGAGFVARQQLVNLVLNALPLRPDAVLILDGFNDLALPMVFGQKPGTPWQWRESNYILSNRIWSILTGYYQVRSQLFRLISRLHAARRATMPVFYDQIFPSICNQYIEATTTTYELLQARDIAIYHVFQPQLAVDKTPSPEEATFSLPALTQGMRDLYPVLAEMAQGCATSNQVPFLSLLSVYSNVSEQIYVDYCHVNTRGQQIVGEAIADFLKAHDLDNLQAR